MYDQNSLLADIDISLTSRSHDWRASALRQLTALFAASHDLLSPQHVALYDQVLSRFIGVVDLQTLADIGESLARAPNAPKATMETLARHKSIGVAGPILEGSPSLSDHVLAAIAATAERDVLLRIARRPSLQASVSDALLGRRDPAVSRELFANPGASISEMGYVQMIDDAKQDDALLALICARADIPAELKPFFEMAANPGD